MSSPSKAKQTAEEKQKKKRKTGRREDEVEGTEGMSRQVSQDNFAAHSCIVRRHHNNEAGPFKGQNRMMAVSAGLICGRQHSNVHLDAFRLSRRPANKPHSGPAWLS